MKQRTIYLRAVSVIAGLAIAVLAFGFSPARLVPTMVRVGGPWTVAADPTTSSTSPSRSRLELNDSRMAVQIAERTVEVPTPDGGVQHFRIHPWSVVAPALQARHPLDLTYEGTGVEDPTASIQMGTGGVGFHAQVLSSNGNWYVDQQDDGTYVAHTLAEESRAGFDKEVVDSAVQDVLAAGKVDDGIAVGQRTSGTQLRTYRLALAVRNEAASRMGATTSTVHAALVTMVARISGIYERELSVKFELVANNDNLIYLTSGTDPYYRASPAYTTSEILTINQTNVDTVIGSANYDVGHVLGYGGNGRAQVGILGGSSKASGMTECWTPTADSCTVDMLSHEIGHQFGGRHTYSGTNLNCTDTVASNGGSMVEPGSGTTIMAYAGICGVDDVARHTDDYFHAKSYDTIRTHIESKPSVGVATSTGNTVPTVTTDGVVHAVPQRTPFFLTASGSDPDVGNTLTYTWEQIDYGVSQALSAEPKSSSSGALFRSRPATTSPTQYFPTLASVMANTSNAGSNSCASLSTTELKTACFADYLPTVDRFLNFRVTVRDGASGGGGINNAGSSVQVVGSTPFEVTSRPTAASLEATGGEVVTWNVAGTASAPYDVSTVDILITTNNGSSWTVLASATANDGSAYVVIPATTSASDQARFMVRAVGSIFYDVNDGPLTIVPATTSTTTSSTSSTTTTSTTVAPPGTTTTPSGGSTYSGVTLPTVKMGKTSSGSTIAKSQKMTVPSGAKITLKVASSGLKYCKVSGTGLKGLKRGSCNVTITVTPKKGKATKKTVMVLVT